MSSAAETSSAAVGRSLPALHVYPVSELWSSTGGFHGICNIGEGGFGKVYRAMVNLTPVAIKVLDHGGLQGLKEFHNEMRLSASVQHQHIVRLVGYAAEGSWQCLVYELMAHGNLEDLLASRTVMLPWPIRVRIAMQMAHALSYLHTSGIIHRDIKPANVFLDHDLNAKLGDIGLASMIDNVVQAGTGADSTDAIGTWVYLAPEYKLNGYSSTSTDVYAFGLTLLQLLTAAEQPRDLIGRCQASLEQCTVLQILDPCAGDWDEHIAARLVKLGLWCCMHQPSQRPAISVVYGSLQKAYDQLTQQGMFR